MEKETENSIKKEATFTRKVWQTAAIVCLMLVILFIVRVAFNILLMALAGALIATYFHGLAELIVNKTKINRSVSLFISIAGTIILLGIVTWFIGARIQKQVAELSYTLPQTLNTAKVKLSKTPVGEKILKYTSGDNSQKLLDTATTFFNTSFGILGDLYIILFLGIFFTADPSLYKNGIISAFPAQRKAVGRIILSRINTALRGWLKSMLISMVLISVLIVAGLTMAGLPGTLVLGLITGMLEIIPNFGPVIAMIPGVLLALTISTKTAVVVALIYIFCQTIVASIVTPLLQNKIIKIPPALTFLSQLIMGTLSGIMGIILAVPLLAILIIIVDELYVKKD